ncbi:ladinin-1-like [Myxocyprinus asiaticus]|uniref:ladinin-1-like n=1 Tax=Myxocyprinus asiaticus TaxID=70543 RepID=UPI0022232726|nr:ladinin-1-like [Myxocyprinus asiaticus]XP_051517347.1 ladinin-1-like [Myxocyprinus asiaticus]
MSFSRKNWSALSSLTRQWTVEDEEEVEREKRRKTRGSSTSADTDESPTEEIKLQTSSVSGTVEAGDSSGDSGGGLAQLQMDFVEMLRVRDERRRMRHVETLRKHKEGEEGDIEDNLDREPHVELLGEKQDDELRDNVQCCKEALVLSEPSDTHEKRNGSTNQDSTSLTPTKSSRKFVSSVSISFDKSPSSPPATSGVFSPLSPRSPPTQDSEVEPSYSPTHSGSMSPTPNGDTLTHENGSPSNFEPAPKPAFTRQSSRTASFRMMRKKEEERMPMQRSASMRTSAKTFESNKLALLNTQSPEQEDEQQSPFQRNSGQRISSRSIQEKMERLSQASQKWQITKSPIVHKTVCLADEVSRKRELFEKEQEGSEKINLFSKQDFRSFSSGISDRVNRWVQKKTFTVSPSHCPSDLRHVNISSKKSLFERGQEQDHK